MLINPSNIPLVVKITNGIDIQETLLPAKKKCEILAGYTLHPDSKQQFPQIVDTNPPQQPEIPAAVSAPAVVEETPVSAETETAAETEVDSKTTETTTRPVLSKKK